MCTDRYAIKFKTCGKNESTLKAEIAKPESHRTRKTLLLFVYSKVAVNIVWNFI